VEDCGRSKSWWKIERFARKDWKTKKNDGNSIEERSRVLKEFLKEIEGED
jgi:hypothetical protein